MGRPRLCREEGATLHDPNLGWFSTHDMAPEEGLEPTRLSATVFWTVALPVERFRHIAQTAVRFQNQRTSGGGLHI